MTTNEQIEREAEAISKGIDSLESEVLTNQERFAMDILKSIVALTSMVNNLEARVSVLEGRDE